MRLGFVIDVLPNGDIKANAVWPHPATDEGLYYKEIATLAWALSTGRLLPLLEGAIARCGQKCGDQDTSVEALEHLEALSRRPSQEGPLIAPSRVFEVRS